MRKITLGFMSIAAFYLLTGFGGTMEVNEPLSFNARKGRETLNQGNYEVELTRKNKNRLRLFIISDEKNNPTETDLLFPEGKNLDQLEGAFILTPEESGQKYFIVGDYSVARDSGPRRWGQQECSEPFRERYCWIDSSGFRRCGERWVTRFGYRNVSYVDVHLTEEFNFSFKKAAAAPASGILFAENKFVKREVTPESSCFIN
jgi:hypothetical protein